MARLAAGGPGLAASLNHKWVACTGAELALYDGATRKEIARAPLPSGDETDAVFVGERVLTFTRTGTATVARVHHSLPGLETAAELELVGRVRAHAVMGDRVLLYDDAGEKPRILFAGPRALHVEPIALREPVQAAAAAPDAKLLVAARDQLECWDPIRRQAVFRLNLPLDKPIAAGFASRRRLLWVGSGAQPAHLDVFRFSDGRQVLRLDLAGRLLSAEGHPESPRLLVAAGGEQATVLYEFDLQAHARRTVELGGALSYCVLEGPAPFLVTGGTGALAWQPLAQAMLPEDKPAASGSTGGPLRPPASFAPRSAPTNWRSRLGTGEGPVPAEGAAATERHAARAGERPARGPMPARWSPMTSRSAETPDRGETDNIREAAETREEVEARHTGDTRETGETRPWRDALVQWTRGALDGDDGEPPGTEGTPLETARLRLALDEAAAAALALLYGAWLLGDGRRGVPAATLARALTPLAGAEGAWSEALGQGELARAGLLRAAFGRLRLRPVCGRFLDGAPPRITVARASGEATGPSQGAFRLVPRGPGALAETLAARLSRDVALIGLLPGRALPARVVEARLHGAVPLVLSHASAPPAWLPLAGDALAVFVGEGEAWAALPELP